VETLAGHKTIKGVANLEYGKREFGGFFWRNLGGIGVYGGENGFWTLLHHRKTSKKAHKSARFDHFCTTFLHKCAAFDTFFNTFLHKNCSVNNSGIGLWLELVFCFVVLLIRQRRTFSRGDRGKFIKIPDIFVDKRLFGFYIVKSESEKKDHSID
jgi:hypothetical protein